MKPLKIRKTRWRIQLLSFMFCCILAILSGCSGTEVGNPDTPKPYPSHNDLNTFTDNQQLESYLKKQYARNVVPSKAFGGYADVLSIGANEANHPDSSAANDQNGGAIKFSNTNLQEPGVDEADVVKTDGDFIYLTKSKGVRVVRAGLPSEEVAAVEVDGYADVLYLYKNLLVVLYVPTQWEGELWDDDDEDDPDDDDDIDLPDDLEEDIEMAFVGLNYMIPVNCKTGVAIYNMADPTNPELLNAVEVDGFRVSSRRIEGKLHLIQQYLPNLPPIRFWYDEDLELLEDIIEENEGLLSDLTLRDLIPFFARVGSVATDSEEHQAVLPGRFYYPEDGKGGGSITTILTFDLDQPDQPFDSLGIVADAHELYASEKSLYILSDRWQGGDMDDMDDDDDDDGDDDDDDDFDDDDDEDDDDLDEIPTHQTDIYKFDLTAEAVTPAGSGRVNGWVLNQFSLGEYNDVLRIATTSIEIDKDSWRNSNNVYCLRQNEDVLEQIGALENIAPGERLYSARFIGERGFLVTFERIDPLFTLDLSDPTNPVAVGELKVPGYSEYIHPWDDNYLITLGKEVSTDTESPLVQGLQLSIFDVTDFASPVLLHQVTIGDRGTHSEALYNHKAFTFMAEDQMLALPVDLYTKDPNTQKPWSWGEYQSSGLHVFRLSVENGFEELGVVPTRTDSLHWLFSKWSRGIFIEADVHAVTSDAVHSAEVNDIENTIQTLELN